MSDPDRFEDRHERIVSYLDDRLSGEERERFERAMFEDDGLWREVERAMEIRAAEASLAPPRECGKRGARRRAWLAIAASAVVVLGAGSVWMFLSFDSRIATHRAERAHIEVLVSGRETLELRWDAVPEADGYVVRVSLADGTPVRTIQAAQPRVALQAGELGATGDTFYGQVQALRHGVVIRTSRLVALATPTEP